MKGLGISDSLGGSSSTIICPASADGDFHSMLESMDEEGCTEGSCQALEKKRRLNVDQVRALEKNFDVENKLAPERKVKLAQELGLQPRQVAVWFQNRRARWKTKQLERDYSVLKAEYDALKHNFEKMELENEAFMKEIQDLKSQLKEDGEMEKKKQTLPSDPDDKINVEVALNSSLRSSDSDSSVIVNEDNNNSPTAAISSSCGILHRIANRFPGSTPPMNPSFDTIFQSNFIKIEEENLLSEDSCSTFFADDEAPTLQWCCSAEWN